MRLWPRPWSRRAAGNMVRCRKLASWHARSGGGRANVTPLQELARALEAAAQAVRRLDAEGLAGRSAATPMVEAFTVRTLAVALGRPASTIRGWIQQGAFPHSRKMGHAWAIPKTDVDRLFADSPRPPGPTIAGRADTRLPPRRIRARAAGGPPPDLGAWRNVMKGGAP